MGSGFWRWFAYALVTSWLIWCVATGFDGVVLIVYCGLCMIVLLVFDAVAFRFGCLLVGVCLICWLFVML